MTTRAPAVCVFPAAFFLALGALTSACKTGGDPGAASVNIGGSAEAKGATTSSRAAVSTSMTDLTAGKATQAGTPDRQLERRTVPGQAQLDLAAAQLAEANARLNNLGGIGASVNARPGSAKLEVSKPGAAVDAQVQPGNPSLKLGKAVALLDAQVQAGKPSLNLGGLKASAKASASAGSQ